MTTANPEVSKKKDLPERYVVLSDMHFGTTETSINDPVILKALIKFLREKGPWREIIFSGDLLDFNLSTVTTSIEGNRAEGITGLRSFLKDLNDPSPFFEGEWVYIPGNHDYFIWDLLSTDRVCCKVLAKGLPMGTIPSPYKAGAWTGGRAFISGVFPKNEINRVKVEYPDHSVDCAGSKVVVSHGHYLDAAQTQLSAWWDVIEHPVNVRGAVNKMFIETAQYQMVAHAASYRNKTRNIVNLLLGPENIFCKIAQFPRLLLGGSYNSPLRDVPINDFMLKAIEFFLRNYRLYETPPDVFVFGHTHCAGVSDTSRIPKEERLYPDSVIDVYNAGAFFPKSNICATFIVIEPENGKAHIDIYGIRIDGVIQKFNSKIGPALGNIARALLRLFC